MMDTKILGAPHGEYSGFQNPYKKLSCHRRSWAVFAPTAEDLARTESQWSSDQKFKAHAIMQYNNRDLVVLVGNKRILTNKSRVAGELGVELNDWFDWSYSFFSQAKKRPILIEDGFRFSYKFNLKSFRALGNQVKQSRELHKMFDKSTLWNCL